MANFGSFTLTIGVAALIAGCAGSHAPIGGPGVLPQASALVVRSESRDYKIVYSFAGGSDGANPYAGLIYMDGTFYGTTEQGGTSSCSDTAGNGCGTVYSVTRDGAEKVLHDFSGGRDGYSPLAGLIAVGSRLYGTTEYGGDNPQCFPYYSGQIPKCGTVFSVTQSGTEKVLHRFAGDPDGAYPFAGLVAVSGTLYGMTYIGGNDPECSLEEYPFACGVVFSITRSGAEKVLHSFDGNPDGSYPWAGLIDVKGTLYGTTAYGGKHKFGTVFSITTTGALKILHSFGMGSDGREPHAGLIDVKGTLYGTTADGGASCGTGLTCGTVFSITPSGKEKVLHSFRDRADGVDPEAPLVELNGNLYGTTAFGDQNRCYSYGCGDGTVFSITPGGAEKVLHYFGAKGDGAHPQAGLIGVNGTLYGTTSTGGAYNYYGTVFSLEP